MTCGSNARPLLSLFPVELVDLSPFTNSEERRRVARRFDGAVQCQVAKCLQSTSKARDQWKAHHRGRPGASCATWQPGGPCQRGPLWEGPGVSFLIHSASVHYSPPL
ncbi:hypothetical protein CHARACLAT_002882 [Characodon lateralis]|uniref:Uncharacterized protein n=1 Tax=Characodon lateralis TaxID=208331 RepID=A0ABU7ERK9_9TELE|nr:hypothetical protein [Characodon lateralis]